LAGRQVRAHVRKHVVDARVDPPGRTDVGEISIWDLDDRTVPLLVRARDIVAALCLLDRQIASIHLERLEHTRRDELLPRHPGDDIDEMPDRDVAEVRVLEPLTDVGAQLEIAQPADEVGARPLRMTEPYELVARQTGTMRKQIAHGDPLAGYGIVHRELGDVLAERRVPP